MSDNYNLKRIYTKILEKQELFLQNGKKYLTNSFIYDILFSQNGGEKMTNFLKKYKRIPYKPDLPNDTDLFTKKEIMTGLNSGKSNTFFSIYMGKFISRLINKPGTK